MNINGKKFTIGADPEVFLADNFMLVSAHDKIPGTKFKPHKVDGGAIQVDGIAAEFNIDPCDDYTSFENNLNKVSKILKDMSGHGFLPSPSVYFDEEFVKGIPKFNLDLGCKPDYNAWTGKENPPPDQTKMMRTAGGHIHIGGFECENEHDPIHFEDCSRLARILDEQLGVYSLFWDEDDARREMYGKAGCFRPKTYGMEYRTLSNMWIFKPKIIKFIYEAVEKSIEKMFDLKYEPDPNIKTIIDTSNRESLFFKNNKNMWKVL